MASLFVRRRYLHVFINLVSLRQYQWVDEDPQEQLGEALDRATAEALKCVYTIAAQDDFSKAAVNEPDLIYEVLGMVHSQNSHFKNGAALAVLANLASSTKAVELIGRYSDISTLMKALDDVLQHHSSPSIVCPLIMLLGRLAVSDADQKQKIASSKFLDNFLKFYPLSFQPNIQTEAVRVARIFAQDLVQSLAHGSQHTAMDHLKAITTAASEGNPELKLEAGNFVTGVLKSRIVPKQNANNAKPDPRCVDDAEFWKSFNEEDRLRVIFSLWDLVKIGHDNKDEALEARGWFGLALATKTEAEKRIVLKSLSMRADIRHDILTSVSRSRQIGKPLYDNTMFVLNTLKTMPPLETPAGLSRFFTKLWEETSLQR